MRNNHLILDTKESYLFLKKYVDFSEYDTRAFDKTMDLRVLETSVRDWANSLKQVPVKKVF